MSFTVPVMAQRSPVWGSPRRQSLRKSSSLSAASVPEIGRQAPSPRRKLIFGESQVPPSPSKRGREEPLLDDADELASVPACFLATSPSALDASASSVMLPPSSPSTRADAQLSSPRGQRRSLLRSALSSSQPQPQPVPALLPPPPHSSSSSSSSSAHVPSVAASTITSPCSSPAVSCRSSPTRPASSPSPSSAPSPSVRAAPARPLPSTPLAPNPPGTPGSSASASASQAVQVTQALSISTIPKELLCREKERTRIAAFVQAHVDREHPGSLYISGKPGTGKTATVHEVIRTFPKLAVTEINCMQLADPRSVYKKILGALQSSECRLTADKALADINEVLGRRKAPLLIVVDEVDQLLRGRECDVLYNIFEWPSKHPCVSVIGIANALDLTERLLPLLAGRGLSPAAMSFAPYTREQLVAIIRQRLPAESGMLSDAAVGLCAAKVTAASGDVRVALDLCRRAVEKSVRGVGGQLLLMKGLCDEVAASSESRLADLPLHQRMLLCAMCRRGAFDREALLGAIQDEYRALCKRASIPPLRDELLTAVDALVCGGLMARTGGGKSKEARDAKVKLLLLPAEVERACSDNVFEGLFAQAERK